MKGNVAPGVRLACLLGIAALLATGCASPQMKGTPFYTGEYSVREGPPDDRVNLWPLMYYRDPALSVLWPFVEVTDDHVAVRPIYSMYGRESGDTVHNVVWPLARYDTVADEGRVFPVFWGEDYFNIFPLYWHGGEPFGEAGGHDVLFPLWCYRADKHDHDLHVLWPIFNNKDRHGTEGWRVWPVAGNYQHPRSRYGFALWPFGHWWSQGAGREYGHTLFPAYWYNNVGGNKTFLSLPYSCGEGNDGSYWKLTFPLFYRAVDEGRDALYTPLYLRNRKGEKEWSMLLPLYYRRQSPDGKVFGTLLGGTRQKGDKSSWVAVPILSWGSREGEQKSSTWIVGPMAHVSRDGESTRRHVFPLFYSKESPDGEMLLTPLWCSGRDSDGDSWQLVPPLMWRHRNENSQALVTPLYAAGRDHRNDTRWQAVVPLYYRTEDEQGKLLATPIGGYRTDETGRRWLIYPLLSMGRRSEDGGDLWLAAPLFHTKWDQEGSSHHLLPFYYWDHQHGLFASPLAACWGTEDERNVLIPPLLSYARLRDDGGDAWLAGGLAKASWGEDAGSSYVFPLYYADPEDEQLITPLWARWKGSDGGDRMLCPPLLSGMSRSEKRSDLWLLGPLAHISSGEDAGSSHVLPFFYNNPDTGTFASPLYASWTHDGKDWEALPPLLSGWSKDDHGRDLTFLLGVFHKRSSEIADERRGHLLPLYYYEDDDLFYTPLFGWNREGEDHFTYPLTPLLGIRSGAHSGSWLFPLYSWKRNSESGDINCRYLWGGYERSGETSESGMFPLFNYRRRGDVTEASNDEAAAGTYGKRFWCLPICWYRNEAHVYPQRWKPDARGEAKQRKVLRQDKRHGAFPLWRYKHEDFPVTGKSHVDGSLLLLLYDYLRLSEPTGEAGVEAEDEEYVRARVLWRLWHYERRNEDVSVDVFPAITYDRRGEEFKKVSFLWRCFRYERSAEGKKMDLLFLPLLRGKAGD